MNQKQFGSRLAFVAVIVALSLFYSGCAGPAQAPAAPPVVETEAVAPVEPATVVVPVTGKSPVALVETFTPEAAPKISVMQLTDGSKLILLSDSLVEVISQPAKGVKSGEVVIELKQGKVLVVPVSDKGVKILVKDAAGFFGRVQGCAMMAESDPATSDFGMKCLAGQCELGNAKGETIKVKSNEEWFYKKGIPQGPGVIDLVELGQLFKGYLPDCALVIPVTGGQAQDTPQPNIAATNACNNFQNQFPGTPCP